MSRENVEVVVRGYELLAGGDWEAASEVLDPNVEQHGTVGGLEEGLVVRGIGQVMDSYRKADESWDEHRMEPEEIIDAGDRVVVLQREYQRGKSSELELEVETAVVIDVRDGRIVRMQGYLDRAAALEAAGLRD